MTLKNIKDSVRKLKREIVPIYYALFDKRTPLAARILAGLTIVYLLSPIDLIPDFIPVLGLLDDIIIVPLLIKITIRLIPKHVLDDMKARVDNDEKLPQKWYYAIPVIVLYGFLVYALFRYLRK